MSAEAKAVADLAVAVIVLAFAVFALAAALITSAVVQWWGQKRIEVDP